MLDVSYSEAGSLSKRLSWFNMYLRYAFKSLFGQRMRYQVVIRVSAEGDSKSVVMALDALKAAYLETGPKYESL